MPRLFVAIDMPEEVAADLEARCHGLQGARWTRPGQFHLTLRFLGDVDPGGTAALHDALRQVRVEPFELALQGLGVFPPGGVPRVLWAGTGREPTLLALAEAVERAVRNAGLPAENRKFQAHVTLGRLKGVAGARLREYLERHAGLETAPFPVTSFRLYSSRLTPKGAVHTVEREYGLHG